MLYFSLTVTTTLFYSQSARLSLCWRVSLYVSLIYLSLSLSLIYTHTHQCTYRADWEHSVRAGDEREEGAVSMPVELCEWGSDEREAHLVN